MDDVVVKLDSPEIEADAQSLLELYLVEIRGLNEKMDQNHEAIRILKAQTRRLAAESRLILGEIRATF